MDHLNPFNINSDEYEIWEILIRNDFEAFCSSDWNMIANDFIEVGFYGIDGKKSSNKSDWSLTYYSLETYKIDWIKQSKEFNQLNFNCNPLDILYSTTNLSHIEIKNDIALVHKEFNARFDLEKKDPIILDWISLFILNKINTKWKIASFVGYLPK